MRDITILALLAVSLPLALWKPWIGVMGWTLTSVMSPHTQFGYSAAGWPVGMAFAAVTLVGLVFTKDRWNPFVGVPVGWMGAFTVWICVTLPFSFFYSDSYPLWERSMKIFLMLFVTLALVNTRRKLETFIWINVISVCYYGVKGGLFTVATGGNYRVWGPGGFIEGNNEVALAVIITVPFLRYLQLRMTDRKARWAATISIVLCVLMALGTYSRGALLGLIAMGSVFWLKSPRKVGWAFGILAIAAVVPFLMPEQWWNRMNTIKTYDSDESAMGRINAWWMAWNLASKNFFGGGFMIWTGSVFQQYAPDPEDPHAAHSIYFQVLGEHGFVGLGIFLAIGISTWLCARRLIKAGREDPARQWAADLGAMVHVSMIGFAVSGAFLSLAYFDVPYNVMAIAVIAERLLRGEAAVKAPAKAPMPAGALR